MSARSVVTPQAEASVERPFGNLGRFTIWVQDNQAVLEIDAPAPDPFLEHLLQSMCLRDQRVHPTDLPIGHFPPTI